MPREVRKLQRVGGGTYTVSIPKGWAVEHGMEAGSDVHLYPHADGSLVVRGSATDGDALASARLDVTGLSPAETVRTVRAAYVAGFESVTVAADPLADDQRRAVRRATRTLVGTEAVEEDADRVVVRNLFDASEVSVAQSLVGMRSVALSTHRAATGAVAGDGGIDLARLRDRRDDVARSFGMVARHLNRSFESLGELDRLGVGRAELFDYYCVCRELDRVATHAVRLAELVDAADDPALPSALVPAAEATREAVDEATTAVLDRSVDRAEAALDARNAVDDALADLERSALDGDAATLRALDCLRRTADSGERIAETALRRTVRPADD